MLECGLRAGDEVGEASAEAEDQVGPGDDGPGRAGPFRAVAAQRQGRRIAQRSLAGEGLGHRDAERLGEVL